MSDSATSTLSETSTDNQRFDAACLVVSVVSVEEGDRFSPPCQSGQCLCLRVRACQSSQCHPGIVLTFTCAAPSRPRRYRYTESTIFSYFLLFELNTSPVLECRDSVSGLKSESEEAEHMDWKVTGEKCAVLIAVLSAL